MGHLTMIGNTALSFGQAVELLKEGKLVQRAGWNGKDMFIFMRPHDVLMADFVIDKVKSLPQAVKDYYKMQCQEIGYTPDKVEIKFTPFLCMKAADGSIVNGWLASQTDMLATDWVEVQTVFTNASN